MKVSQVMTAGLILLYVLITGFVVPGFAQTAPSNHEVEQYNGIHDAAHRGDVALLRKLIAQGVKLEEKDRAGRTALHIAAFSSRYEIVSELAKVGADMNALENDAYDIVTIAAVANDLKMLDLALNLGASAANITSPYDGTALIAAAHLGHYQVVRRLIKGGAPLDHVNNLHWTALIEAVVLGNGEHNHIETVRALVSAGADYRLADRRGVTPLEHARDRGYSAIISLLETK
jgi:ankyrin repeat protein